MHNCKETRKLLTEQALDQIPSDQSQALLAQLEHCPACREEFASLRSVLRVADQAMQSALPAESFWSGYHERLQQSLTRDAVAKGFVSHSPSETGALVRLRKLFTTSLRVPVPVAALLIILFGLSIGFAARSRPQSIAGPPSPGSSVVTRTVEVPVIQERTVTRVVYRDRKPGTSLSQPERPGSNSVAGQKNRDTEGTPISLVGFKPANEVKLTIIKGSYRDEK